MLAVTWLIIALPLLGFAVLAAAGRRLGDPVAGIVGTVFVGASFLVSVGAYFDLLTLHGTVRTYTQNLWTWIPVGALQVHASLFVDPLSMTMVLFVTGISTLIHLYSIGYMKGDRDYPKFFLYMNLFVASMLILVLGSNMLVTFVGWEGVGACSYWLVSFWFARDSAASAGKKAFIYNRIGDVGFLLAIFLTFERVHSLEYTTIFANIDKIGSANITAICLLLLVGVMGKSAQIPLFPWLADAMEGPTPVSALIHAATMVTAGVYLLCRVNPLLHASSAAALTVAIVGGATAFVAATIACAQQDIKKVLAYSTVSQLGYMFLAIGCGAYEAAIFLMIAHAFFKGLLFLGAGSAIHGLHDEQDLKRMGNLRAYMPITFITFGIGWLAIAAVPPLSGYWAKGDVLDNTWAAHPALWVVGIVTAALTAYYMSRLTGLAFFGKDRWKDKVPVDADTDMADAHHAEGAIAEPHESPWIMTVPLWILAFFAAVAGVLGLSNTHVSLSNWIDPVFGTALFQANLSLAAEWALAITDAVVAVVGVTIGLRLWMSKAERPSLEGAFLRHSWYINELYDTVFGRPSERLAAFSSTVIDDKVIDGGVNGVAALVRRSGSLVRRTQTGYVRNYVLGIVLGTVLVLAFMLTPVVVGLMATSHFPFLTALVLAPAIGAVVVALVPSKAVARHFHEAVGALVGLFTLVLAIVIAGQFKPGFGGYQMVTDHIWAKDLGLHWSLGIDGISLFLVVMSALLFPLALIGAHSHHDPRSFVAWVLVMESACLGSFVSLDLVFFFLFFELTLVPAYFLISGWGYARRGYAAIKFFIYTFAGSAFLLVGILAVAFLHQSQTGVLTFELPALMHTHFSGTEGVLLFLAFTAAFAVKAPIFPFHTWSPDAYAEAPTAGAVLLAAVMAKLGTYGIIRFDLNLFPQATRTLAPLLLTLAVIGIIYGALVACAQRDLKRLLAYSSLAGIGFIVLGTFALNSQGLTGGVLQMVNHGLIIATLFILVGWIYERRKTWQVSGLKGLQRPAPILAGCFTVAMMASIGVPGLNGFVGEFLVLIGTFLAHRWWAVVGIAGIIVAAIYLLWAYQQVFHGEPTGEDIAKTRDLGVAEKLVIAPLIFAIVFLGVFPKPVLDRITPSVNQLVIHVDRVTHTPVPSSLQTAPPPVRHRPTGALALAPPTPASAAASASAATAASASAVTAEAASAAAASAAATSGGTK